MRKEHKKSKPKDEKQLKKSNPNMSSDYDGEGETPPAPPVRHTSSRPSEGPHGATTTLSAHGGHADKPLPREPEKKPKTPKIKRGEKKEVGVVKEMAS